MQSTIIVLVAVFLMSGCSSSGGRVSQGLREDRSPANSLTIQVQADRETVFRACIDAIRSKTKAKVRSASLSRGEIFAYAEERQEVRVSLLTIPTRKANS